VSVPVLTCAHRARVRATPSPKVTELFCRLPLPTLFYRLEAVHLGDLMRLWVRPRPAVSSLGFSRSVYKALRTHQTWCAFPASLLCAEQFDFKEPPLLKRKESSSRRPGRRLRVRARCRHAALRFRNLNRIPFRGRDPSSLVPRTAQLRIDSPVSNCCSHGTLPHFSLQAPPLNICYYHQDLH